MGKKDSRAANGASGKKDVLLFDPEDLVLVEQHRVPATVKRGDAATLMGMMVSENEQREEDTPLGRAKKVARFMDLGRSEDEAAVMMGVSKASIKNMLGLLDAPASVRKAVESGAITSSDGYKLAKLEPEEAAKRVEKLKTEAPRTPGKKRSSNGAKAREIVDGKKRKKAKPEESISGESVGVFRSATDIMKKRDWVADHLRIPGESKRVMDLIFDWLSGNDESFAEFDSEAAE